jgi:hypothetical protein
MFLHLVGSSGHITHSVVPEVHNVDALFSYSGGTGTDMTKSALGHVTPKLCFAFGGICGSRCTFQRVRGMKCQCTIFHNRVGPVEFP